MMALYAKRLAVLLRTAAGKDSLRLVLRTVCLLLLAAVVVAPAYAQYGISNKKKKQPVSLKYKNSQFCPPSQPISFTSFTYARNGWSCEGTLTGDGLRLTNVKLGSRMMSEYLCVPYIGFKTNYMPPPYQNGMWVPLRINTPYCRLVDIREEGYSTLRAEWVIDKWPIISYPPQASPNCLRVVVRWKFESIADRNPPPKPPRGKPFIANQLTPTVSYEFDNKNDPDQYPDTLMGFWAALRMAPSVNGDGNPDNAALIRDCELNESGYNPGNGFREPCLSTYLRLNDRKFGVRSDEGAGVTAPGVAVRNLLNNGNTLTAAGGVHPEHLSITPPGWGQEQEAALPLSIAVRERAVTNGSKNDNNFIAPNQKRAYDKRGDWDNVHVTNRPAIDLPVPMPPGCPECFHYHWRWFGAILPDFGPVPSLIPNPWGGVPMVDLGAASKQQQDVVIVPQSGAYDTQLLNYQWTGTPSGNLTPNGQNIIWMLAWDTAYGGHNVPKSQFFFSYRGIFYQQFPSIPNPTLNPGGPEPGAVNPALGKQSAHKQTPQWAAQTSTGSNEYRAVSVGVGESYTYRVTLTNPGIPLQGNGRQPLSLSCVVPGNARIESWEIEGADTDLSEDGTLWTARFDKLPKGAKVQARVRVRFLSAMESGKPTPVTFQTKTGDKDAGNTGQLFVRFLTNVL